MNDTQLLTLIQSLSLEEKAALCSGADLWTTKPNYDKNIPSLRVSDGPHGVRREDAEYEKQTGQNSFPSTCFPSECVVACSFSTELTYEIGQAMGKEAIAADVGILLGPGTNIKRSPLGGRNFEYYSEDPILSGELSAGLIQGIQSQKVGTSLKHFAVNNQETKRLTISSAVDERAFFDIYLKPFEIAVKKAKPSTVMCSYNRIAGVNASDNRRLLTDILRLRFGFDGTVLSDWGATNDRVAGIMAGLDLEMPFSGGSNDYAIVQAVKNGTLQEDLLDTACWNILKLVFTYATPQKRVPANSCDYEKHYQLAVKALEKSAVLLKNNQFLPLSSSEKVAIIGEMAEIPHYQGGGSSLINAYKVVPFLQAMDQAKIPYAYAKGYTDDASSTELINEAIGVAKKCDKVLLFLGLSDLSECEAFDRDTLSISQTQIDLLNTIYAINKNICVVLSCGSPIETPWLHKTKALLCNYLGGEGVGEATVNLLFGKKSPSGKLAETWPLHLEDTPSYFHFPMGPNEVTYNESLYVGYRYYDTANIPVQFPFGFGLSYTNFKYDNICISNSNIQKNESLSLSFSIENIGDYDADEITQVYLQRKNSDFYQPAHQLVSFVRTPIDAKQKSTVNLNIPYSAFSFYDPITKSNIVENGEYYLEIGTNSREIVFTLPFSLEGVTIKKDGTPFSNHSYYGNIQNNRFIEEEFNKIYTGKRFSNSELPQKGEYTFNTTMDQLNGSFWGRRLHHAVQFVTCKFIRFSTNPKANRKAGISTTNDLPFRNIMLQTGGIISKKTLEGLLDMCNGKHGLHKVISGFITKPPYKKKGYLPQVNKKRSHK